MSENFDPSSAPPRRLVRVREGRMIAGVCTGIARYFNVDPVVVRLAFIVLLFAGGSGLLIYLAAWLVMPEDY
jgi:phage shock protein C